MRTIKANEVKAGMRIRLGGWKYPKLNRTLHRVDRVEQSGGIVAVFTTGWFGVQAETSFPAGHDVEVGGRPPYQGLANASPTP
jgi:hypothetical protein